MLRRLLLALLTALIVARPLVLGEDPGLLDRLSNAWSLLVGLLWFVAAVGWAVWRAWSGQTTWRGSAVEAGLLAVVALIGVSAVGAAHYKHPALLVASEWLVLLCAFCLVRQLARTPEDNHGLLAALLANAVSLAAFAVYQYTVEFPEIRRTYGGNLHTLLDAMAAKNLVANPQTLQRRLFEDNVFATYSHPNSFAGYLALLIPVAIAWTFAAKGNRNLQMGEKVCFFLALASTLLIGLVLWLTHSRGAILACLLVGFAVLAASGRRFLAAHKTAFLSGLGVVVVLALFASRTEWAASGMAKFWQSSAKRNDYWIATWNMIRAHPWRGVGPGNFGRLYPSYMLARAFEKVKDPHNFILEIWATGGVFALIAFLITLGMFFRRIWSVLHNARPVWESDSQVNGRAWNRWEFYVGGMVGLVLGFVFRALDQSGDEILLEGALSACRSIIWFAAFAWFYRCAWSGASQTLALTAGVAALLLNLLVSGGIAMPSIAQPLWIMAALALNSIQPFPAHAPRSASWLPRMLPLPLLGGIGLAYFMLLLYPAVSCGDALSKARRSYVAWPGWRYIIGQDKCYVATVFASAGVGPLHPWGPLLSWPSKLPRLPDYEPRARLRASHFLQSSILMPLESAVGADPGNASAWLELAEWYGEQCRVSLVAEPFRREALLCAERAQLLDPDNKEAYLFQHRLYAFMAQRSSAHDKEQYGLAAAAMGAAVECDPTEARLHY
jgi:hypothetical protein